LHGLRVTYRFPEKLFAVGTGGAFLIAAIGILLLALGATIPGVIALVLGSLGLLTTWRTRHHIRSVERLVSEREFRDPS